MIERAPQRESERDLLSVEFERHRAHLRAVAFRMLGSVSEADDAVQESWLRLSRSANDSHSQEISNLGGWLTTVVARVSLDQLRVRRALRESSLDDWLPQPAVLTAIDSDPEHEALLADSVGLALLVVLDTLTPAERLAFVLHDMFAVPFDEIAPIVERTPAATRQLASRARRRVRGSEPPPVRDTSKQRQLVDAFLAASRAGDFDALVAVLDPDVVFRIGVSGEPPRARPPIQGAGAVAEETLKWASRNARFGRSAIVNGTPGLVVAPGGQAIVIVGFTTAAGRITAIDLIADPNKLNSLTLPSD
jgi:RNA polymerase sigma factor (sigma-70 family)